MLSTFCKRFVTYLSLIYHLHSLSLLSEAAPVAELNQMAATSQGAAMSSNQLSTVVQQAVSSSVENLGANATLNNNSTTGQLVNSIVTRLLEAGVQTTPKCKPRTHQELKQLFLNSEFNRDGFSSQSPRNGCLGLEKLTGLKDDVYYITTNSSCSVTSNNIHIDSKCYGNVSRDNHCSMDTELQPIVKDTDELENYFPQYVLQMMCRGCSINDECCLKEHSNCYVLERKSPTFRVLRRDTRECNEEGYENWIFDNIKQAVVACSCRQSSD